MSSFRHSKKSLVALLVGAPLSLSLVACGSGESSEESDASASESTVTSTTSAEDTTEESESEASESTDASDDAEGDEGADGAEGADGDDAEGDANAAGGNEPAANSNNANNAGAAAAGAGAGQNPYTGGRSASAPDVPANQSSGEPAAVGEVEAAVQNQFDPAHYENMLTLWDHTQGATCASALQTSQQAAKDQMAEQMPAELQNVDIYALMEDPTVGPVVRDQLAAQPGPAAPQLNSINNVDVSGQQATVNVSTNEGEQDMSFVNEGGVWKVCS